MKSATDRLIEKLLSTGMNMTEVSHLLTRFMEEETIDYIDHIASRIKNYEPDPCSQVHEPMSTLPVKASEKATNPKIALNTKEACTYLGINRSLLDSFRRCGLIKSIKMGRLYIYPTSELNAFIDRNMGKEITKDGLVFD